ncbi:MAG TPA: Stk1 family PASTA domain-containing Ser/Thr kinase [Clostridiaceae bacterium]|nr:Stk1 family PASTA domain-containing Ser/Thr kinase [Clostridiaceae bacterium]
MITMQPFAAGTIVAERYCVVRTLGQGGMATVYLADDLATRERVAVKVMHADLANDPEFVRRFATEARAAASLDHPNIVRVLDYGSHNGVRYIVQEYIEGNTLKEIIRRYGAIDYRLATPLLIQVGLALEHAHNREVIHRDIKPQNILITPDMVAKVTDFGIARASSTNTITLTGGVVMGSVHYFSPEQARGGQVTARSDLYSLGILYYEMLTGVLPFDGESSVAVAIKHLQEVPPAPSTIISSLPPALDRIINRAIQKNPDARYQTARELVDELDAFMVDPQGVYGVIPRSAAVWEDASTSAIGVQNAESNFRRMQEIERTYSRRRSSRFRETAIAVTVVTIAIALLAILTIYLVKRFSPPEPVDSDQKEIVLPNFQGSSMSDIVSQLESLEEAGMKIEKKFEVSETVLPDIVLRQDPESDGNVRIKPKGLTLTLYISIGKDSERVPDVVGQTSSLADITLRSQGFVVKFTTEPSDTVPKGQVIRTNPESGELVPYGATIELVYSAGPSQVLVPKITGLRYDVAIEVLTENSLLVGGESSISGKAPPANDKWIIKQSPSPNTTVSHNTLVTIVVGTAQELYNFLHPTTTPKANQTMPLVEGSTFAVAKEKLSKLGVATIRMKRWSESTTTLNPRNDSDASKIFIILQSPAPGVTFKPADGVDLIYGSEEDYHNYVDPPPPPTDPPTPPSTTSPPTTTTTTTTTSSQTDPPPPPTTTPQPEEE